MDHCKLMMEQVKSIFNAREVKYKADDEDNVIRLGYSVDCKLSQVNMLNMFSELGCVSLHMIGLSAAPEYRTEVLKYINMINHTVKDGTFEMDPDDGEVRFRLFVRYEDLDELPESFVDAMLLIPYITIKRYGNGLAAVMMGFSDAETAFEEAGDN